VAPSIKDVARQSGVSYRTVSRVVNGSPHVRPATRQRVEAAIADLRYAPDHAARSLRRGRTRTLRLLIVRRFERFLTEPFLSEVVSGIVDGAAALGHALLLETTRPEEPCPPSAAAERQVDGTILIDVRPASPLLAALVQAGAPCVALPTRAAEPGVGWVYADFGGGAERAVAHLLALGHRRIAHLADDRSPPVRERRAGYERALAAAGLAVDPDLVEASGNLRPHGDAAMDRLLARGVDFTAVFAANDLVALGAVECLGRHGRRVPADVSVVGFDDIYLAPYAVPPLTTVRLPSYEMGRTAAALAVAAVEGTADAAAGREFPVELVVRGSTAPPAGAGGDRPPSS